MNSALQCLSHCEELTKYFLLKKYIEEINPKNKYGSGGLIAKAYFNLMKELWVGTSSCLNPWEFRQIFVGFVKQFAGFSQHDSQEMLTFMLDALHEDLNRVKDKPYFELNEKQNSESEAQASSRWWQSHLSRENSIIVDLFHGQFKSKVTCPECQRISITYDPFMYLGLPIPHGQGRVNLKFFPLILEKSSIYKNDPHQVIELSMSVNENTTFKEIKTKISKEFKVPMDYLEGFLTHQKNFKKKFSDASNFLHYYENSAYYEIIFYQTELEIESSDVATFYVMPVELVEEKSFFGKKTYSPQQLFYVKPFTFSKYTTVKDVYIFLFKYYRKIFVDLEIDGRTWDKFLENYYNYEYIMDEFRAYFTRNDVPFRLKIINNMPDNVGYNKGCEFCSKISCDYCSFEFDLNKSLDSVIDMQKVKRPFLLQMEVLKYNRKRLFEKIDLRTCHDNTFSKNGNLSIYDCLNSFRSEEKLGKENAWYCSRCQNHQQALKKLEIYTPPNLLIVQFKRFKVKSEQAIFGMLNTKKNDCLIDFPVDNLNLTNYIVGEAKDDAIYELFAISQHFGSVSSGHYTALCRNKNRWCEFDDDQVSSAGSQNVVTSAAYLLFYRKKSLKILN